MHVMSTTQVAVLCYKTSEKSSYCFKKQIRHLKASKKSCSKETLCSTQRSIIQFIDVILLAKMKYENRKIMKSFILDLDEPSCDRNIRNSQAETSKHLKI